MSNLIKRFEEQFEPCPTTGCWLWLKTVYSNGYGSISVNNKRRLAHRLSYTLFVGPIPDGICVLHHCDVPCCVNPAHLFLGTHLENMRDMVQKSRSSRGEKHWLCKFTDAQIELIREKRASGATLAAIGKEFGTSKAYISQITRQIKRITASPSRSVWFDPNSHGRGGI